MFFKSGKSSKVLTEENQVFQKSDSSLKLGSLENIMNRLGSIVFYFGQFWTGLGIQGAKLMLMTDVSDKKIIHRRHHGGSVHMT